MKSFRLILILSGILVLFPYCTKSNYGAAIIGTWEWTGFACNEEGSCKKEVITDEDSRETFAGNGLYISKRIRNNYMLKNGTIYFASDKHEFKTLYAEIVSIKKDMMLLKFNNDIRRYNRISAH